MLEMRELIFLWDFLPCRSPSVPCEEIFWEKDGFPPKTGSGAPGRLFREVPRRVLASAFRKNSDLLYRPEHYSCVLSSLRIFFFFLLDAEPAPQ